MGKRLIPDKIENFNVYLGTAADSNRLIGITDEITLPKLENMSETINLAGMAGEYDSPTVGQYKSMEIEIPFSNISKETLEIAARDNEPMIMRSSQEFIDPETHKKTPGSISFVPSCAGLIIASVVVRDLLKIIY